MQLLDNDLVRTENLANSSEYLQTKKISEALQMRLREDKNYTYIGDILLAVDPAVENIRHLGIDDSEPHIYNLCRNIIHKMNHFKQDELLLTSGLRGANKQNIYDSALLSLLQLGERNQVCNKILAADKILSCLLREKRTKESCSLRMTRLMFNRGGLVSGAKFEVSSLACRPDFARNWNNLPVFDWVLCGLRQQGRVREFGLQHLLVEDIEDEQDFKQNLEGFRCFVENLSILGFRADIGINLIFRIVGSIILLFKLGSILLREPSHPSEDSLLAAISNNLELDPDLLKASLYNSSLHLNCSESFTAEKRSAVSVTESLACLLYTTLIDWIENFINAQLELRFVMIKP